MRAYDESAQTHFVLVKPSLEVWNEAELKTFKKRLSPDHHKQGKHIAVVMGFYRKKTVHIRLIDENLLQGVCQKSRKKV